MVTVQGPPRRAFCFGGPGRSPRYGNGDFIKFSGQTALQFAPHQYVAANPTARLTQKSPSPFEEGLSMTRIRAAEVERPANRGWALLPSAKEAGLDGNFAYVSIINVYFFPSVQWRIVVGCRGLAGACREDMGRIVSPDRTGRYTGTEPKDAPVADGSAQTMIPMRRYDR